MKKGNFERVHSSILLDDVEYKEKSERICKNLYIEKLNLKNLIDLNIESKGAIIDSTEGDYKLTEENTEKIMDMVNDLLLEYGCDFYKHKVLSYNFENIFGLVQSIPVDITFIKKDGNVTKIVAVNFSFKPLDIWRYFNYSNYITCKYWALSIVS